MSKLKKSLLLALLIVTLIATMFVITGCGSDTSDDDDYLVEDDEVDVSYEEEDEEEDSSSTVISVPMRVVNEYPDVTITELYLSGAGLDTWGDDVLGDETMPTDSYLDLTFNIDSENIEWDIKTVTLAGQEITFTGLDLSNVSTSGGTITLSVDEDGSPVATVE